ncbi:hypothetical protein [Desulfobacula sp.]
MDTLKKRCGDYDRRKFTYTAYVPERRSGTDKRQVTTNRLKARVG